MKSTLGKIPPKKPELHYPCLLEDVNNGSRVVLFTGPGIGTVLSESASGCYTIGYRHNCWEMSWFRPYDGVVVLEN